MSMAMEWGIDVILGGGGCLTALARLWWREAKQFPAVIWELAPSWGRVCFHSQMLSALGSCLSLVQANTLLAGAERFKGSAVRPSFWAGV